MSQRRLWFSVALTASLALACSKAPHVLEIPELAVTVDIADVWRPADPAGSENPMGFTAARIESAGEGRSRVAKQPKGGTEIVYVTGKFPLPFISIFGLAPRPGLKSGLEDCAARAFEKEFDAVSWELSPSTVTTPGMESRATIANYQTRSGTDLTAEILVIAKDGYCYTITGTTAQNLWPKQQSLIEGVLASIRPLR